MQPPTPRCGFLLLPRWVKTARGDRPDESAPRRLARPVHVCGLFGVDGARAPLSNNEPLPHGRSGLRLLARKHRDSDWFLHGGSCDHPPPSPPESCGLALLHDRLGGGRSPLRRRVRCQAARRWPGSPPGCGFCTWGFSYSWLCCSPTDDRLHPVGAPRCGASE
jgi:hypothetical protein